MARPQSVLCSEVSLYLGETSAILPLNLMGALQNRLPLANHHVIIVVTMVTNCVYINKQNFQACQLHHACATIH